MRVRQTISWSNNHIDLFFGFLISTLLVFSSRDTWLSRNNNQYMYISLITLVLITAGGALYKSFLDKRQCVIVSIMVIIILCSMVVNRDFSGYSLFIILLLSLFISETLSFELFYSCFEMVVWVLLILSMGAIVLWWIDKSSYSFLKMIIRENPAVPWGFRLYGVFREPAMYCIYLGIGLIKNIFDDRRHYVKELIYLLAIFLTGSTTGYLACVFLYGTFYLTRKPKKYEILILSIGIVCLFYLAGRTGVLNYFIEKLQTNGANAASSNSRYYSIIGGAIVGLMNPLCGAGAINSELEFNRVVTKMSGTTYCWANMVTYLWASFGCVFICIFLLGIYGCMRKKGKKIALIFLTYMCLLLCGETMTYSAVMFVFMLYGYKNIWESIRNERLMIGNESFMDM